MNDYLSRHVDNDDMRHYAFSRNSGLRREDFATDPMEWVERPWVRRAMIVVFALAVAVLLTVHADVPDEAIRATAVKR